jgi:hypothetical protein
VKEPDFKLDGVILVDALHFASFPPLVSEQPRLVVIVHKEIDDLFKLWYAGVRHVVFYGDPPKRARIMVLGVELMLWYIREKCAAHP